MRSASRRALRWIGQKLRKSGYGIGDLFHNRSALRVRYSVTSSEGMSRHRVKPRYNPEKSVKIADLAGVMRTGENRSERVPKLEVTGSIPVAGIWCLW
jgi:hypothetical protein